jgi:hypothetical protein
MSILAVFRVPIIVVPQPFDQPHIAFDIASVALGVCDHPKSVHVRIPHCHKYALPCHLGSWVPVRRRSRGRNVEINRRWIKVVDSLGKRIVF